MAKATNPRSTRPAVEAPAAVEEPTVEAQAPVEEVSTVTVEDTTTTTVETVPAVEAPAGPSPVEAFTSAVEAFATGVGTVEDAQGAYRKVPAASRGAAQSSALVANMANLTPDMLTALLTALSNLPAATRTRTERPVPTDAQRWYLLRNAVETALLTVPGCPDTVSVEAQAAAVEAFATEAGVLTERLSKVLAGAKVGAVTRTAVAGTLAGLVEAGTLPAGTVLVGTGQHAEAQATVLDGGRLDVAGAAFDSVTSAARSVTGHSVNGWDFWRMPNGASVGSLRTVAPVEGDAVEGDAVEDEPTVEDADNA